VSDAAQAVAAGFDARAATYDAAHLHRALATAVAAFCPLDGMRTVLDVGTGTGLVLRALRPLLACHPGGTPPNTPRGTPRMRLIGVDLSPAMLAVARAALPEAVLVVGDAAALPLADGSIDLVTYVTVLHLLPDADAAFAECARVLRPGGRVVTATFGPSAAAVVPRPYPRHHERFATPALVGAAAAPEGLIMRRHRWWRHDEDTVLLAELTAEASVR